MNERNYQALKIREELCLKALKVARQALRDEMLKLTYEQYGVQPGTVLKVSCGKGKLRQYKVLTVRIGNKLKGLEGFEAPILICVFKKSNGKWSVKRETLYNWRDRLIENGGAVSC